MPKVYKQKLFSNDGKASKNALSAIELSNLMSDINTQPDWRSLARKCMA